MKNYLFPAVTILLAAAIWPAAANAQRDYFTPEEVELIRNAQQIDQRVAMLTLTIDRRFTLLKVDVGTSPVKVKDDKELGVVTGSRQELLFDIKRILQKAIDDIDNLASRPDSMVIDRDEKKPKSYTELFPKAVRILAAAAERYRPALKSQLLLNNTGPEQGSILDALDMTDQITTASAKLPPEVKKGKN